VDFAFRHSDVVLVIDLGATRTPERNLTRLARRNDRILTCMIQTPFVS
jgi:hypothetical protein